MPRASNIEPRIKDLRAALSTLDNTYHYTEVLLFNRPRLDDPSISAGEQVQKYANAKMAIPAQSIEEQLAGVGDEGDFTQLRKSVEMEGMVDSKGDGGREALNGKRGMGIETQFEGVEDPARRVGQLQCGEEEEGEVHARQTRGLRQALGEDKKWLKRRFDG